MRTVLEFLDYHCWDIFRECLVGKNTFSWKSVYPIVNFLVCKGWKSVLTFNKDEKHFPFSRKECCIFLPISHLSLSLFPSVLSPPSFVSPFLSNFSCEEPNKDILIYDCVIPWQKFSSYSWKINIRTKSFLVQTNINTMSLWSPSFCHEGLW